jgi:hypothetical protein
MQDMPTSMIVPNYRMVKQTNQITFVQIARTIILLSAFGQGKQKLQTEFEYGAVNEAAIITDKEHFVNTRKHSLESVTHKFSQNKLIIDQLTVVKDTDYIITKDNI